MAVLEGYAPVRRSFSVGGSSWPDATERVPPVGTFLQPFPHVRSPTSYFTSTTVFKRISAEEEPTMSS